MDTYGIPRYREVNPGIFTIITFPFLFAVMFADLGHGAILLILGIYLTLCKENICKRKDGFSSLIEVRYIILLMGIFSVYCGLIYNEFLSIPLNLFNSCYSPENHEKIIVKTNNCEYQFGIDPIWGNSENQLTFVNSFKMNLAVIIGVLHMLFGILIKGINSINFKKPLDFLFEFIP